MFEFESKYKLFVIIGIFLSAKTYHVYADGDCVAEKWSFLSAKKSFTRAIIDEMVGLCDEKMIFLHENLT